MCNRILIFSNTEDIVLQLHFLLNKSQIQYFFNLGTKYPAMPQKGMLMSILQYFLRLSPANIFYLGRVTSSQVKLLVLLISRKALFHGINEWVSLQSKFRYLSNRALGRLKS